MIIDLNNNNVVEEIDLESLQKETIESMKEYIPNLIQKFEGMVIELRTNMQEDSWEYLRMMIDGFNWVIDAYNGTSTVVNKSGTIDEKSVQETVDDLGEAFIHNKVDDVANVIDSGVVPFLKLLQNSL